MITVCTIISAICAFCAGASAETHPNTAGVFALLCLAFIAVVVIS